MAFSDRAWNIEEYSHPSSFVGSSFVVHNLYLPLMYQKSSSTLTLLHNLGACCCPCSSKILQTLASNLVILHAPMGSNNVNFFHCCDTLNVCCVPNKNTLCLVHIQRYCQTILNTHQLCRHCHNPCTNLNRMIIIHLSLGNCLQQERQSTQRSYKIEQIKTRPLDHLKITNVVYHNHYTTSYHVQLCNSSS